MVICIGYLNKYVYAGNSCTPTIKFPLKIRVPVYPRLNICICIFDFIDIGVNIDTCTNYP